MKSVHSKHVFFSNNIVEIVGILLRLLLPQITFTKIGFQLNETGMPI